MKLYFGHTRLQSNTNDLINHSLQTHEVEARRGIKYEKILPQEKSWNIMWIDNIIHEFQKRNIVVERDTRYIRKITANNTVMNVAVEYTKDTCILGCINQVCRYKKVLLLMELVGTRGENRTKCLHVDEEKSSFNWIFMKKERFSTPQQCTWKEERVITSADTNKAPPTLGGSETFICNGCLVACIDAAVKNEYFGGHWYVLDTLNEYVRERAIDTNTWEGS